MCNRSVTLKGHMIFFFFGKEECHECVEFSNVKPKLLQFMMQSKLPACIFTFGHFASHPAASVG